ncbi:hypothetical protein BOX15_Mlig006227g3 [Macrostomum lignano]|uniref:Uncharacterized protein n=2 Tax=Macrostomum lignano TaxID=282301 RepID=A0A267DNV8_9PLAT|nr:hypothetical protein BOX15_Mlig006227g3 [Macrostomum lignano]
MSLQRASRSDPPGLSAAQGRVAKVVLLGDFGSGKSSLYQRLTLGESGGVRVGEADTRTQRLQLPAAAAASRISRRTEEASLIRLPDNSKALLYDTCSMEQFNRSLTHGYYRGAACVILVADASNLHSVRSLDHWNVDAGCYAPHASKILVFTKSDSEVADKNLISWEFESYQARLGCYRSAVVSSKTGRGIDQLLEKIAESCQHRRALDLQQQHQSLVNGGLMPISLGVEEAGAQSNEKFFELPDFDTLKSSCCQG